MRRQLLLPLFGLIFLLFSCKKENVNPEISKKPNYEYLISKIKAWLEEQKTGHLESAKTKIESLKSNLNYEEIHLEKYKDAKEFLVLPIGNAFESANNVGKNPANYLVLVFANGDSIVTGNIIQYVSSNSEKTVPKNTFSKIFNYQNIDCSGWFTTLSITDYFRYELKFEDGKIKSVKQLSKKRKSENTSGRLNECIDWYEQTWFVRADGTAQLISEVYVFTTCDGDCWQPRIASGRSYGVNCNDNGSGGGIDYDACVSAAISSFQSETTGVQAVSEKNGCDFIGIDEFTKYKNPKWTILRGWSGWTLESQETGVIKLVDQAANKWAWKSLVHSSINMVGTPTPGVGIEYTQGVGTPSFTPETAATSTILYGGMSLSYLVTYRLICNCPNIPGVNLIPPIIKSYTSNAIWDSNPI